MDPECDSQTGMQCEYAPTSNEALPSGEMPGFKLDLDSLKTTLPVCGDVNINGSQIEEQLKATNCHDDDDHSEAQLMEKDEDHQSTSSSSLDDQSDDDDDDATYVTSNQNKSVVSAPRSVTFQFRPQSSSCSVSINSFTKNERWSAGDGPSTTQSTSSKQSSRPSRRKSVAVDLLTKDSSHDIADDLKSKPGLIAFTKLEETFDEEEEELMDASVVNSYGHASKTTHSSGSSSSSLALTEERVRSHMVDYYEDYDTIFRQNNLNGEHWDAFFRQYFTDDILWIRSTGNPLDREGLKKLMIQDIVGVRMAIVSIDSIQILAGGKAAVVVFTADQVYLYKGKHESDRTVLTSVLHVVNGCEILIGHEHRCVGKPIPENTRWE